jgi:hypothetical protein
MLARDDAMSVNDHKLCPKCRAENDAAADYCWQCFERFSGRGTGRPPRGSAQGPAPAAAPTSGFGPRRIQERQAPRRRLTFGSAITKTVRYALIGVVVVGALIGGKYLYGLLSPGFPSTIGQYARDLEPTPNTVQTQAVAWAQSHGFDISATRYGSSVRGQLVFELIRVKKWTGQDTQEALLVSFVSYGSTVGVSAKTIQKFKVTGVTYLCVPTTDSTSSVCGWLQADDEMIMVDAPENVQATLALTEQAHDAF